MKLKRTDAGRKSAGFDREKNDCTVRALATAANIPYAQAHAIAREAGRKTGRGIRTRFLMVTAERHGIVSQDRSPVGRPTLARVLPQLRHGRFIVTVNGHAMAVINGIVHDLDISGARCRVKRVWEVTPATKLEIVRPEAPQPPKTPTVAITQTQINELWERLNRFEARQQ